MPSGIYKRTEEHRRALSEGGKGKKLSAEHREKLRLKLIEHPVSLETRQKISSSLKNHTFSQETRLKISVSKKLRGDVGEKSAQWKGDNITYFSKHQWLAKWFGKAVRCDNLYCLGISHFFQWAKKREHEYTRYAKDYYQLCVSCHRLYDHGKIDIVEMAELKQQPLC